MTPTQALAKAREWWHEWGEHYPADYDDPLDVERARQYNEEAIPALAALIADAVERHDWQKARAEEERRGEEGK